ncbi:FG-GAP-like repeat-containing protein [Streptomyces sp. NPDC002187]|uniref:FG-GAP-like repeat-containing protein n=1 Tax=Streptomyces sp. NPDC002187 TaxID=3364637 RepID=UPI0036755621
MRTRALLVTTLVTTALAAGLLTVTAGTAPAAPSGLQDDFNGDGYRDLAIGAPIANIDGHPGAGLVAVVHGGPNGLDKSRRTLISQATAGIPGVPEVNDHFGSRLTTGDLDGDGYTDLVVGVPGERVGSTSAYGVITVAWGGPKGLTSATGLATPLPAPRPELGRFLAAGDFDGDGSTDLATVNSGDIGGLHVFEGPFTRTGKATARTDVDLSEAGIRAGRVVAGNVDGDGASDLLVLGTDEVTDGLTSRSVLYRGGKTGLTKSGAVAGGPAAVIADVDKDGYGDIVTGNPEEKSAHEPDGGLGGAVTVTYGSAFGLSGRAPVRITQDTAGVPGTGESHDRFGTSLSSGDTDGDGFTDIAVGVRDEALGSTPQAGQVVVLRGSATGLTGTGAKAFTQDTAGVPGTAEPFDHFGSSVRLLDSNKDRRAELAVGAPTENNYAGSVWLLKTGASGITATGSTSFGSTTLGGPSGLTHFGDVLAN